MVVMMDIEISCKGHCEKLSHFLDHVSHTECYKTNSQTDSYKCNVCINTATFC